MKKLITICLVYILATTMCQGMMIINFDENGNGTYQMDQGLPFYQLVYGVDTPPIGGYATLYYNLPFAPVNEGDLLVREPGTTGEISDVLRFINVGDIARVYIYSELPEPGDLPPYDLADTGIPSPLMSNIAQVTEIENEGYSYAVYVVAGFCTYNFTSNIPEPATLCLLSIGALSLIRRKK